MKDERRYWVNAPFGIPDLFDAEDFGVDEEERKKLKHIEWVYKTWDKEEAIETAKVARENWKE